MPTKVEIILEMMRNLRPWKEIVKVGRAQTYQALETFLPETEEKYHKYQEDLPRMKAELVGLEDQINQHKRELRTQEERLKGLRQENNNLKEVNEDLQKVIQENEIHLQEQGQREKEYHDRGVTPNTFKLIDSINFGTDNELVTRIDTFEKHKILVNEVNELQNTKEGLIATNDELEEASNRIVEQTNKQRNALLEEQGKYTAFKEDIDQLSRLRKLGIKGDPFLALVESLNIYSTGEPATTIDTLLQAVMEYKNLQQVRSRITESEARLIETQNQIDKARGTLESITRDTEKNLVFARDTAIETIRELEKKAQSSLIRLEEETKRWGDIREEAGRYAEYSRYGYLIMGLLADPNAIYELRPHQISNIMSKVHRWVKHNYGETEIKPPESISNQMGYFAEQPNYKLHLLSEWLSIELGRRANP